jgi:hypothetical protein
MVAGRYALASRLVTAVVLLPLAWFALLWLTWIPISRPLHVTVRVHRATTLIVFRDIGREFYPGDAVRREILPGTTTNDFALPAEARALRLELLDVTGLIEDVSLGNPPAVNLAGTAVSAERNTITIGTLPPVNRPPLWLQVACAGAALALLGVAVSRRGSAIIVAAWRRIARPEAQASFRGAVVTWSLFASVLLALGVSADACDILYGPIDNPPHWPISIFDPRTPAPVAVVIAAVLLTAAHVVMRRVAPARKGAIPLAMGLCVCALVAGNSFGGWQAGFVEPTASGVMYLADALSISSVRNFLATFVEHQPQLRIHGRTHPPGAELLFYVLFRLLRDPGAIALFLGLSSMLFASACVYGILRERCGRDAAVFGAVCFASVPAVQVYFITSIDAVICASVAGAVYCFLHRAPIVRVLGTALFLALTMFLSFAALFLICVLLGFDLLARRSVRAALGCFCTAALSYIALYLATGFNWLRSLLVATKLENRDGFALLAHPGTYLFTRIEGAAELALFAGPMLLILWIRSLTTDDGADPGRHEINLLSRIGLATLSLMLIAGAFKTGETARACAFLYPFIVLPVAASVRDGGPLAPQVHRRIAFALLAQALTMQVVGDYYW